MNVLVAGSRGFIGHHALLGLPARGHKTLAYPGPHDGKYDLLPTLFREHRVDAVIYAAGPARLVERMHAEEVGEAMTWLPRFLSTVPPGPLPHLILLSSHAVYGQQVVQPIGEDAPLRPRSFYAALQVSREALVMACHHAKGFPVTILRLGTVYGHGMRKDALVQVFLDAAREGREIKLEGGGEQVRPFVHIDDLLDLFKLVLDKGGALGASYNVAAGHAAVGALACRLSDAVKAAGGPGAKLTPAPARSHEEGDVELNTYEARSLLGWAPEIDLDNGIPRLVRETIQGGADG